jgi:hypothetical protein
VAAGRLAGLAGQAAVAVAYIVAGANFDQNRIHCPLMARNDFDENMAPVAGHAYCLVC